MALNDLYSLVVEALDESNRLGLDASLHLQAARDELAAEVILTDTAKDVDVDGASLHEENEHPAPPEGEPVEGPEVPVADDEAHDEPLPGDDDSADVGDQPVAGDNPHS